MAWFDISSKLPALADTSEHGTLENPIIVNKGGLYYRDYGAEYALDPLAKWEVDAMLGGGSGGGGGAVAAGPAYYGGPTPIGKQPVYDQYGGIVDYTSDPTYNPAFQAPKDYYGGQTPLGYQPVYDNAGNVVDYKPDPSYQAPKDYYGGQTPLGYQPVYDTKGNVVDYKEDPSYQAPGKTVGGLVKGADGYYYSTDTAGNKTGYVSDPTYKAPPTYYGGTKDMGGGIFGLTDQSGGIVSTGYAPGYVSPEEIRQFDAKLAADREDLDKRLAGSAAEAKMASADRRAAIASGDRQAAQASADRQAAIAADITNTRAQIASNEKIASIRDATERYIAGVNAGVAVRGQDVQMRGQNIGYATDTRSQDISREANIAGAYGSYMDYAGQQDPFRQAVILTGGAGGTTPFELGASQYKSFIDKLMSSYSPVGAAAPLPAQIGAPNPSGGLPLGSTVPGISTAPGGVKKPVYTGDFSGLNTNPIRAAGGVRSPDQIISGKGREYNILVGDDENPRRKTGAEELVQTRRMPAGTRRGSNELVLQGIVPNDRLRGMRLRYDARAAGGLISPTQPAGFPYKWADGMWHSAPPTGTDDPAYYEPRKAPAPTPATTYTPRPTPRPAPPSPVSGVTPAPAPAPAPAAASAPQPGATVGPAPSPAPTPEQQMEQTIRDMLAKIIGGTATPQWNLGLDPVYGQNIGNPQDYAYTWGGMEGPTRSLLTSAFGLRGVNPEVFNARRQAYTPRALAGLNVNWG